MTLALRKRGIYALDLLDAEMSLFLDAYSSQSYPGSGSIWYDLTNNFHIITLEEVEPYENFIEFNGQESFLFSDGITVSGPKTMSVWMKSDRPLSDIDSWQIGFVGSENPTGPTFGLRYGANSSQDLAFFGNSTSHSGNVVFDLSDESFTVTNSGTGAYVVDGVSNPTFNLVKGNTYTFVINASGHPFWIQTVSGGYSSADVYSTGTTNLGTDNGAITWTIPTNAPNTLYYACEFHSSMQGTINLIDSNVNKWSSDNIWHNVVISMDAEYKVKGYVDGQQISWVRHSDSQPLEFITLPSDVTEEFSSNSVGEWVSGWNYVNLGEIRVYNKSLSNEEISLLYNAKRVRYDR
jgi:hypothetical protein